MKTSQTFPPRVECMLMLFLTVAMVHIVALMSPDPDLFFVFQTAVGRSRKEMIMGVLGIACDVMIWAGIALLSLHLVIEKVAWLHTLTMAGGDLYLCWVGYQILRGALKKEAVSVPAPQAEPAKGGRSFLEGLLTNLVSPEAIIYFGSVSSLSIGDNVGTTARWGTFALIIVETLVWLTIITSLFAPPRMRRGYQRLTKWIDGFAGALLAGFGIHLIISWWCQTRLRGKSGRAFTPHPTLFFTYASPILTVLPPT